MSEAEERRDRDARLRAEPGEPPALADQQTARAYWAAVAELRARDARAA